MRIKYIVRVKGVYVVFLAVYSETHVILLIQYDVSKMAFACVGALYMLYP